jgi:tRNA A-37 threonylcarbamoyl transferase component Bud32
MGTDRTLTTAAGRVLLRGVPQLDARILEWIESHGREGRVLSELTRAGQARLFVKGSALRGKAAVRHGLRRRLLGRPLPRVREYENLRWLEARIFQVPPPRAAAVLWSGGLPRYQLLVTAEVRGAVPLGEALPGEDPAGRSSLARELGREVGRMHALGFVHRDLFPRNLLVLPKGAGRRLVFLDAWRAGPHASLRGPAYDLGCLFLEGADLWTDPEQQQLIEAYVAARQSEGHRTPADLLPRARREREGLIRRLRAEPARLRGATLPGPWRAELRWRGSDPGSARARTSHAGP